jgi:hypothetical protein
VVAAVAVCDSDSPEGEGGPIMVLLNLGPSSSLFCFGEGRWALCFQGLVRSRGGEDGVMVESNGGSCGNVAIKELMLYYDAAPA